MPRLDSIALFWPDVSIAIIASKRWHVECVQLKEPLINLEQSLREAKSHFSEPKKQWLRFRFNEVDDHISNDSLPRPSGAPDVSDLSVVALVKV